MGCSALKRIFNYFPSDKIKLVVWLVPSDSILTQTINSLSNPEHPYRRSLDKDFAGRVEICTKEMLLSGQNFTPDTVREMLSICVLSYASLRIDSKKKDVRKVFQENGNLMRFSDWFGHRSLREQPPQSLCDSSPTSVGASVESDTALISVLRNLEPVVIVDESHNAGSTLSEEMLINLNPSLILELTATPREKSNIISYVDARELKKENMVKLPVVVFNRNSRQSVFQDAIQLRGNIEKQAQDERKNGGEYIRPIVLFQAPPNTKEESDTFDKIKSKLLEIGIPKEQIAIKTSKIDDLKNINLLSENCEIRYIITINALKEGWDCPFAYILASLANKSSKIDVEQILGRILRQPYARKHQSPLLNTSYVFTSSQKFHDTLDEIVNALNKSGFSRKDCRVANDSVEQEHPQASSQPIQMTLNIEEPKTDYDDSFADVNSNEIQQNIASDKDDGKRGKTLAAMIETASKKASSYNQELESNSGDNYFGGNSDEVLNTIQEKFKEEIQKLRIPQFFIKTAPSLFGEGLDLLTPQNLSDGFSLTNQDAQISFELATGETYAVDIATVGEAVPKYRKASINESQYLRKYIESLPEEKRIEGCADSIASKVNENNSYITSEVKDFVKRCIANMTSDELSTMEANIPTYALKIKDKISALENIFRAEQFKKLLDSGKIVCKENFAFPMVITTENTTDSIDYSLYEAEKDDMNSFEKEVIDVIVGTNNIRWWHRVNANPAGKDFFLNGFFKHYPDFMVMTNSGKIVLVEAKGDYLDGDDSKAKLELGRKWQEKAGDKYRYFMVFKNKQLSLDGAYTLDKFVEVMKEI